jgi:alcohol dehydrogenase, propanol-preferring
MQEALDFAARGKVTAQIETHPFSELNKVFGRLREGKVMGRIVLEVGNE